MAEVVQANAKGVMQADGVTPVSGDHSRDDVPPSENDYSIGVRLSYGGYAYATAGDNDGEYNAATWGDRLRGGRGRDRLYGQRGDDMLRGGRGRDFGDGGRGHDTARSCERQVRIP